MARFHDQLAGDHRLVCADNSLPQLLTEEHLLTTLGEMRRVLRSRGLLLISTRPYDLIRRSRPVPTAPQLHGSGGGRTVTFQLTPANAVAEAGFFRPPLTARTRAAP
ncbi:hypothetical protein [Streptomyces sp. NPDC006645]|uniref:hypothetical protein n=1 Tax=unclassified Streptomyces TaxID=2593676 RepID=UPI0033B9E385